MSYTWGTYCIDRAFVSTVRGQKIAAFPCQAAILVDRINYDSQLQLREPLLL